MEDVKSQYQTDDILELDRHLVHSFADLHGLEQPGARTVIAEADEDLATRLVPVAAAMRTDRLGIGTVHFRMNASQLHNAIRRRMGGDTGLAMSSRTAIARLRSLIDEAEPVPVKQQLSVARDVAARGGLVRCHTARPASIPDAARRSRSESVAADESALSTISSAPGRATITTSEFPARSSVRFQKHSRRTRLTRLRSTAFPTLRPTEMPSRGPVVSPSSARGNT